MDQFIHKTIGDFFDDMAEKYPDNDGLVYVDRNLRLSYREFNKICNQVAKGFLKMGIKKGDHVAMWATNYPEWIMTMFATAKIGAVLVTVNTSYKIFELEYLMRQSDSNTLLLIEGFKDANYVNILYDLVPELKTAKPGQLKSESLPCLKNVIYLDKNRKDGMFCWEDILELGKTVSDEELFAIQHSLDPHDVINMQYTSGTTGFPKGVMLTHYNILNNGFFIGENMKFTHKDRLCIPVPFFHCFGMVLAIMASLTHGTTMVPIEAYSPVAVMNAIQTEHCTAVHGVPTMFIFMLEHPDFNQYDFSSLRTGIMAGSPCPIATMRQVVQKMNMKEICITYGQTEASPATTMTCTDDPLEVRVSSVGKSMPAVETKLVDPETLEEVPMGTPGEFCSRGYNTMKGYYKMEEATRNVIDEDGWLHSGDLAVIDKHGYYKITGRIKDMIIRGGENIYPMEIEELLYTYPKVQDVQVVGVPSKKFGEEVMAFIIPKAGETVTEEEIKAYVKTNMARHKVPSYVRCIDELPMTGSGKIQKFKLREMAVELLSLQADNNIETA